MRKIVFISSLLMVVFINFVYAYPSPTQIPLNSGLGQQMLNRNISPAYFQSLMSNYQRQQYRGYCVVASAVIILNALEVGGSHYHFNQHNFFIPNVAAIRSPESIRQTRSLAMIDIVKMLKIYKIHAQLYRANQFSSATMRKRFVDIITHHRGYIMAVYENELLGQTQGGHASPVAAYDPASDSFLILDVTRPAFWVKTERLWQAMHVYQAINQLPRGYVYI